MAEEVLVTGGAGFIGRHLVKTLNKLGSDVISTRNMTWTDNIRTHVAHLNLTNFNDTVSLISRYNPKVIFHLAAQPLVETATRHPFDTMEVNIRGAYNLLEAIRQAGTPSAIIWMSTDKVYGNSHDAQESNLLDGGWKHPYNASKLCGDILARMYAESFGLPIVVIRSGNIYGEADFHWDRLIPGISRNLIEGERPKIRSNGNLKRDYIYVSDVVGGLILAATATMRKDLDKGTAINFGSPMSYSVLEVVDELLSVAGKVDLTPIIQNRVQDELQYQHLDYTFAKERLGWEPKTDLKAGIERTFLWYKRYLGEKK